MFTFTRIVCTWAHVSLWNFFWCILYTYLMIVPSLVKIWVHFAEKLRCVTLPKLRAHFHALCVHASTCTPTNIINQLRRLILIYTESFVNIWLNLAEILRCERNMTTQLKLISDATLQFSSLGPSNRHHGKCYKPSVHRCSQVGLGLNENRDRVQSYHRRWFFGNFRNIHFPPLTYWKT